MTGLYIHFPFCVRKCAYCDFHSVAGRGDWMAPYVRALCAEARRAAQTLKGVAIDTVYLGGGTPTLFPVESIAQVLDTCREVFHITPDAEISIEANPATVDTDALTELRKAGVNRLSIGAQSFSESLLQTLGRIHRSEDIHAAVQSAVDTGFHNISIDLMYGIPGQTLADWRDTLDAAVSMPVTHISAYALKIEPGTPFYAQREAGTLTLPGEDAECAMQDMAIEGLAGAGFHRYEVSNYARPGYACRHNLHYWRYDEYLGLGSGACGRLGAARYTGDTEISAYIEAAEAGLPAFSVKEILPPDTQLTEAVMMGLRLTAGIRYADFRERFGLDMEVRYGAAIRRLCELGWGVADDAGLRLTKRGMDLQNQALLLFLE